MRAKAREGERERVCVWVNESKREAVTEREREKRELGSASWALGSTYQIMA